MADLGPTKIGSNYQKLLQQDGTIQDGSGSAVSLNISGNITASGIISSSDNITSNIVNVNTRVKAIGSSLEFAGDQLDFVDGDSLTYLMRATSANSSSLYYSGQKKLETAVSGINVTGHISASSEISASSLKVSGDILLDEDQRIYFEADKQTWMEANGANLVRIVTNNNQMLLLDHETGNRAVFGNGTKVFIGENNNALPTNTLEVDGNISASAAISASTGMFHNLPTSDPGVAGTLWVSGSTGGSDSSKILVVSQG